MTVTPGSEKSIVFITIFLVLLLIVFLVMLRIEPPERTDENNAAIFMLAMAFVVSICLAAAADKWDLALIIFLTAMAMIVLKLTISFVNFACHEEEDNMHYLSFNHTANRIINISSILGPDV